jgi:hypothetical protein
MTGGGLAKNGVGHEVFLIESKNIRSVGGSSYFIIVGENLTCNDYCYRRERARQQIYFMYQAKFSILINTDRPKMQCANIQNAMCAANMKSNRTSTL